MCNDNYKCKWRLIYIRIECCKNTFSYSTQFMVLHFYRYSQTIKHVCSFFKLFGFSFIIFWLSKDAFFVLVTWAQLCFFARCKEVALFIRSILCRVSQSCEQVSLFTKKCLQCFLLNGHINYSVCLFHMKLVTCVLCAAATFLNKETCNPLLLLLPILFVFLVLLVMLVLGLALELYFLFLASFKAFWVCVCERELKSEFIC